MKVSGKSAIVYINLDRVPERRKFMEKELNIAGLSNTLRFSAIDAKKEGKLNQARFISGAGDRWSLPKSAIACFESHRAVWQIAVDQDLDAIIIFEDDVLLSSDIGKIISAFVESSNQFDIIKLDIGGLQSKCAELMEISGFPVRKLLARIDSAGAYILSNSGAKKLLQRSNTYGDTLDDFLYTPLSNWRMYQLFPAAVAQVVYLDKFKDKFNHFIENKVLESEREESPEINPQNLPKGPFWFRMRKEFRRMQKSLYWRLKGKKKLLQQDGYYGLIPISKEFEVRFSKK
jgi:GR25 family glycosyltransferase involved in LPS biosynthesis